MPVRYVTKLNSSAEEHPHPNKEEIFNLVPPAVSSLYTLVPARMKKAILVCDGEQRSALAVARSLGRCGHIIHTCSHEATPLTADSRFVSCFFPVPSAAEDPVAFLNAVRNYVGLFQPGLIIPISDHSNGALLGKRNELAPTHALTGSTKRRARRANKLSAS